MRSINNDVKRKPGPETRMINVALMGVPGRLMWRSRRCRGSRREKRAWCTKGGREEEKLGWSYWTQTGWRERDWCGTDNTFFKQHFTHTHAQNKSHIHTFWSDFNNSPWSSVFSAALNSLYWFSGACSVRSSPSGSRWPHILLQTATILIS